MTKIVGNLPSGDANGLHVIARSLIEETEKHHIVIAVLKTKRLTTDVDTGDVEATARIVHVEVVHPGDAEHAERLMRRALEHRHGGQTLPLEMEDELTAYFSDLGEIDWSTGEIKGGGEEQPTTDEPPEDEGEK